MYTVNEKVITSGFKLLLCACYVQVNVSKKEREIRK